MSPDNAPREVKKQKFLRRHPVFILLFAFAIYSIGIWNCQFGGGEDTAAIEAAQQLVNHKHFSGNIFTNIYAFILGVITSDPVNAITIMRFIVALACTLGLYSVLMCFSSYLSQESILMASFVWIAACVNTPIWQSTCLSAFAFSLIITGIVFFFRNQNAAGLLVYYLFAFLAASLRPEYLAPLFLVTLFLLIQFLSLGTRFLETRFRFTYRTSQLVCLFFTFGALMVVGYLSRAHISAKIAYCDSYLLFGFQQCYADFYHYEHPTLIYTSMTEYTWLMQQKFGDPHSFFSLLWHYPTESARYLILNSRNNLVQLIGGLFQVRDQENDELQNIFVWLVLDLGFLLLIPYINRSTLQSFLRDKRLVMKFIVLLSLASASSVSIILLIPSVRYWISIAPLLYLLLACCFDRILGLLRSSRDRTLALTFIGVLFCYPHYSFAHPNSEFRALQHIAPLVEQNPTIVAWWAEPDRAFGFNGKARAQSTPDNITVEEIKDTDILLIDHYFRSTRLWNSKKVFFEDLELNPAKYGFHRVTDVDTGRFDILYRPSPQPNNIAR